MDIISFGARDAAAVDEMAERLGRGGVRLIGEPGKLASPGGCYGLRFFDPEGRVVEVSADVGPEPYRELQAREEEYLRGTGRLIRAGYRPLWGPGRHSAGDNTYAYFADPDRNVVAVTETGHRGLRSTSSMTSAWRSSMSMASSAPERGQ